MTSNGPPPTRSKMSSGDVAQLQAELEQMKVKMTSMAAALERSEKDKLAAAALSKPSLEQPCYPLKPMDISRVAKIAPDAQFRDYKIWELEWLANARLIDAERYSRSQQVAAVLAALGPHAAAVVESVLGINPDDSSTNVQTILKALRSHYRATQSLIVDRFELISRRQKDGENFDQYLINLRRMMDEAAFNPEDFNDALMSTLIVAGVQDVEAQKAIFREPSLPNLKRAIEICKSFEAADNDGDKIRKPQPSVSKVSSYTKAKKFKKAVKVDDIAKLRHCDFCNKDGHTADRCFQKARRNSNAQKHRGGHGKRNNSEPSHRISANFDGSRFVLNNTVIGDKVVPVPKIVLDTVDDEGRPLDKIEILPDTGAEANLICIKTFRRLWCSHVEVNKSNAKIIAANNRPIPVVGEVVLPVSYKSRTARVKFLLTEGREGALLGYEACWRLGYQLPPIPDELQDGPVVDVAAVVKDPKPDRVEKLLTKHGRPRIFALDGATQFLAGATQDFLKTWGILHRVSSPMFSQSNGLAENVVQSLKAIVKKTKPGDDCLIALMEQRAMPRACGRSAAELFYGRPISTLVPSLHGHLARLSYADMSAAMRKASEGRSDRQ
ncbi:hypothetical protein TCAL_05486 [Tigriopus californicus]|uniref:Integrase catalytic domain-containing protein n=1 Tax=Tigriopus californicus TaxID=6832 RepID=A0A553PB12_TIGCA|nr:hypothetical protein TCAL_05486 [Tigriopus californicus]